MVSARRPWIYKTAEYIWGALRVEGAPFCYGIARILLLSGWWMPERCRAFPGITSCTRRRLSPGYPSAYQRTSCSHIRLRFPALDHSDVFRDHADGFLLRLRADDHGAIHDAQLIQNIPDAELIGQRDIHTIRDPHALWVLRERRRAVLDAAAVADIAQLRIDDIQTAIAPRRCFA